MSVKLLTDELDIARCFAVYQELRPHLSYADELVNRVITQFTEGFQLAAIFDADNAVACCGFREMNTLAWGKIIYIDDLATLSSERGKGYASKLLEFVIQYAKDNGYNEVHLDSGYQRLDAHRLYLNQGFNLSCHHFQLKLS